MMRFLKLLAILVVLVPTLPASAVSTPAVPSGITVSPVLKQLQLQSGQDSADFDVLVTNNTVAQAQIKIGFVDFKALNESGGIAFLGEHATELQKSHGLAKWVQLSTQQLGLDSKASGTVTVHLQGLLALPPGGHYGAVTYQVLKASPNGAGNRVTVNQVLTSLVFLVTAGGGTQHLTMPSPGLDGVQFQIPSSLDLFFTNDGNTQTAPRGSVQIDRGDPNHPVGTGVINTGSALVLPSSTRLLPTRLTALGRPWWPHQYHIRIHYRPDNSNKFSTYNAAFLYINPWLFVVLPLVASGGYYSYRWLRRNPHKVRPAARAARAGVQKVTRLSRTRKQG
jgi:hypothetical protein